MPLMMPNPNGSGDGNDEVDEEKDDIVLLDENGNKIHFNSFLLEELEEKPEDEQKESKK